MKVILDNEEITIKAESVSGSHLKSHLPNHKRDWQLYKESDGNTDDKLINDDDSVDLRRGVPLRLYTVPKAING